MTTRQQQEMPEEDEEMSDAETEQPSPQQTQQHSSARSQQSRPRHHDTLLNQQIIAAWQQGHRLDPEIEQFLKEQSERGTLHANVDVVSNFHPRALRGYLRPSGTGGSASAAAAAGGGPAGAVASAAGRAAA